jgi:hypothetical protein
VPQLRDAQLQGAGACLGGAIAIAVAPGGAFDAALVAPGPDQPLDTGLSSNCSAAAENDPENRLRRASFCNSGSTNLSSVIGHRSAFTLQVEVVANSTLACWTADHLNSTAATHCGPNAEILPSKDGNIMLQSLPAQRVFV